MPTHNRKPHAPLTCRRRRRRGAAARGGQLRHGGGAGGLLRGVAERVSGDAAQHAQRGADLRLAHQKVYARQRQDGLKELLRTGGQQ